MRIQLKQKVKFGKKTYGPGLVDLPDGELTPVEIKYLHKMVEGGLALEPDKAAVTDTSTELERKQRLSEKLLKLQPKPRAAPATLDSLPPGVKALDKPPTTEKEAEEKAADDEEKSAESKGLFGKKKGGR